MIWYMGTAGKPLLDPGPELTEDRIQLLDDRLVRTVVAGLGEPLVVFKAGIGVGASVWVTVQPLVAAETRTLKRSFDGSRPGRHAMSIPRRDSSLADREIQP
jgi:hypothetical protein